VLGNPQGVKKQRCFGEFLFEMLNELGVTQAELCNTIKSPGKTASAVKEQLRRYRNDELPPSSYWMLPKIADFLASRGNHAQASMLRFIWEQQNDLADIVRNSFLQSVPQLRFFVYPHNNQDAMIEQKEHWRQLCSKRDGADHYKHSYVAFATYRSSYVHRHARRFIAIELASIGILHGDYRGSLAICSEVSQAFVSYIKEPGWSLEPLTQKSWIDFIRILNNQMCAEYFAYPNISFKHIASRKSNILRTIRSLYEDQYISRRIATYLEVVTRMKYSRLICRKIIRTKEMPVGGQKILQCSAQWLASRVEIFPDDIDLLQLRDTIARLYILSGKGEFHRAIELMRLNESSTLRAGGTILSMTVTDQIARFHRIRCTRLLLLSGTAFKEDIAERTPLVEKLVEQSIDLSESRVLPYHFATALQEILQFIDTQNLSVKLNASQSQRYSKKMNSIIEDCLEEDSLNNTGLPGWNIALEYDPEVNMETLGFGSHNSKAD